MAQQSGKLLNPFAFPSETHLRSILLIWAILGLCWGVGFYFTKVLVGKVGWQTIDQLPRVERNILHIDEDRPSIVPSPDNLRAWLKRIWVAHQELEEPGGLARKQAALADLSEAAKRRLKVILPYFVIPLFFLVLVLLCILVLYVVCWRRIWLSGSAASWEEEKPEFNNALQALIKEAQELQRRRGERPMAQPRILLSRGAVGDGQVFGSSRRPVILLTRAMPSILRKDIRQHGRPYLIRAAVLHELAHLANRDVTRSYWAEASWGVLIPILTLLTATLWMLPSSQAPSWLQVGVHVLAILLVVELIRRGILRYREYDADLRAALLWNTGDPLRLSLSEAVGNPCAPGALQRRFA